MWEFSKQDPRIYDVVKSSHCRAKGTRPLALGSWETSKDKELQDRVTSKPDDSGSPKRKETLIFNRKERRGAGSPVGVSGCFSQAKVTLRCELWNIQERCQVLVRVGDC